MNQPETLRAGRSAILRNKRKTFLSKPHNVILLPPAPSTPTWRGRPAGTLWSTASTCSPAAWPRPICGRRC